MGMIDAFVFDQPLLVFGGPYSNLQAMQALLAQAHGLGVSPARMICTGDVVAYGADGGACVDLLRDSGVHVVAGNCEIALGENADDCGCGFAPGSTCDLDSRRWFAHGRATLSSAQRAWMRERPHRLDVEINGLRLAVIHGSLSDVSRFVFASTPARVKALDLNESGVDGIVAGHCGLPFTHLMGARMWHNAGTIGMPANDGTPRVWFSLLTPGKTPRSLIVEHMPLDYDHAGAAAAMRAVALPESYAKALGTGLWPSCDVLPLSEVRRSGESLVPERIVWDAEGPRDFVWPARPAPRLDAAKFRDPQRTARGEERAHVALDALDTLWINTGTLCNLACASCYIESTPRNDRLVYMSAGEVAAYLDEIARDGLPTRLIGFTGGEPFLNRDLPAMLADVLGRGLDALVLTNAMKPMQNNKAPLLALHARYGPKLTMRVSIDHYSAELHELERGPRSWQPTLDGLHWLADNGFALNVAGRLYSGESESIVRAGYAELFAREGLPLDAMDPVALMLFPEMDAAADVPEITESCWGILGKSPHDVMCSSSRMVVKRKGADKPAVLACTLLAYDEEFELGTTLAQAARPVSLNHPHCATFCVLGSAACSRS
ncbi:MAG: hypothetical protein JWL62_948 [Hyphomicrobiales bacterium]|nr:hypothetical protein [Hyphomicrobiales bacterium]